MNAAAALARKPKKEIPLYHLFSYIILAEMQQRVSDMLFLCNTLGFSYSCEINNHKSARKDWNAGTETLSSGH